MFNVAAVNGDHHTKSTAFLCTSNGAWSLASAFDLTHSYRIDSTWVARHQMSVNDKTEHIARSDLETLGDRFTIRSYKAIISEVSAAITNWAKQAASAGVPDDRADAIAADMAACSPT